MRTISKLFILILSIHLPAQFALAKLPSNISDRFQKTDIEPGRITIKAPDIAENGAVVNVAIGQVALKNKNTYVKELWLFDHFRKQPLAHFKLGKHSIAEGLKTRFKLAGTSVLHAVALLSDGSMISGAKTVKITIGGCGGSSPSGQQYRAPGYYPPASTSQYDNRRFTYKHGAVPFQGTEKYASYQNNGILNVLDQPVSTFSVDVDTGSYSNVRRFLLNEGRLPHTDAVRVEEMINYFSYQYPQPDSTTTPFTITTEVGPSPWKRDAHLMQIGLQGYREDRHNLPPANLVFLIDVSGSMRRHDKIGLLKSSLRMLTNQLGQQDRIAIVVYAGASGLVLDSTPGSDKQRISQALDGLSAGGSTNGGAGIRLAYNIAQQSFISNGINRVILATDGDFNVGTVNHQALIGLIKQQRKTGISLTTLGFGTGNYNERLMEQLADHGDGNYAYIDTLREARKVLVSELSSTLLTIARDVKIQVEFNPAVVAEYRLIGYENRQLRNEDFKHDGIDAGDIGAGHSVTALYEISFVGSEGISTAALRYASGRPVTGNHNEIAYIRMRYKRPKEKHSTELSQPVYRSHVHTDIHETSNNFRFAAAVASFGQILRNSEYIQALDFPQVHRLAQRAVGRDVKGYRREFLELVDVASAIKPGNTTKRGPL